MFCSRDLVSMCLTWWSSFSLMEGSIIVPMSLPFQGM
uniref:Uncharacterized protein n=1 Tax=Lepeophtheirus salmonis TaxID=72036 RepID=A0A0K2TYL3_LEPSM